MINTLICIGKQNETAVLDGYVRDTEFLCDAVLPVPPEAMLYGEEAWKRSRWGCTANGANLVRKVGKDKKIYEFTTDGAPIGIFKALMERYPWLRFVLYSKGEEGRYHLEARKGALTKDVFRTDKEAWL